MQFDFAFSKLKYAELAEFALHPDLNAVNLVEFMARRLAQFSQENPGVLGPAVAAMSQAVQRAFNAYVSRFELTFS
jgi:hypothetical protein